MTEFTQNLEIVVRCRICKRIFSLKPTLRITDKVTESVYQLIGEIPPVDECICNLANYHCVKSLDIM